MEMQDGVLQRITNTSKDLSISYMRKIGRAETMLSRKEKVQGILYMYKMSNSADAYLKARL